MKTYRIIVDIRDRDVDGNAINTDKVMQSIMNSLNNEWNVSAYDVTEIREEVK